MLVVETNEGVEGVCEDHKQEENVLLFDGIDDDMNRFVIEHNLQDIQRHLFESKLTMQHLEQMYEQKNSDGIVDEICDSEWKLKPTQKIRFKYALKSFDSQPRKLKKKVVIIGDSCVGKSCLLSALVGDPYRADVRRTIGVDWGVKVIKINDKISIKYLVWDTAGQEAYRDMSKLYYRGADALLLVYDTTWKKTLNGLPQWLKNIEKFSRIGKILLVGSKIDNKGQREVSIEEAKSFAITNKLPLLEVSAKTRQNIDVLKQWMMESIDIQLENDEEVVNLNKIPRQEQKKSSCC